VQALANWYSPFFNRKIKAMDEILITIGGKQSLYYAFMAWLRKGDEVM
jgi:aspartate/methionine/tyrosine aminotransferase